ncbi:MAG: sulfatase/phosphatase domain-containing protein, partial [Vicinamibacteraceae bacterium]
LIVLTGDNGPTAWPRYYKQGIEPPGSTAGDRGRKWSLYEGGIRQPLITRWPGRVPAGRVDTSSIVTGIDFFLSLTAIAGVEPPKVDLDGEDASAALLGKEYARQRPIMWEYRQDLRPGKPSDVSPELALREKEWKLLMNRDGSRVELYNLFTDPRESRNLATLHPRRVQAWAARLNTWMQRTAKP